MSWWTGWEAIAKRRWFLNEPVPPLSPTSPHLAPQPPRRTWPAGPGQPMVGQVLTGNGITADGDGHDSLIGGSLNVRVGFARDPELNSWGWLCATRSAHQPL